MTWTIALLLVLGVALLIAEAHLPSGVLGVLGVAAFIAAGLVYRDEGHSLPVVAIVLGALAIGGLVVFVAQKALAAHRDEPVRTGSEELIGAVARVREPLAPEGQVFVEGSLWRARLRSGADPVQVGGRVRIESVEGLTLVVVPENGEEGAS